MYDENPAHIWNRLYSALRVREDSQGQYPPLELIGQHWRIAVVEAAQSSIFFRAENMDLRD
jgi:hypothetical protein